MKVILEWKINPLIGLCPFAVMSNKDSTVSSQVVPSVIPGCGRQEDSRDQAAKPCAGPLWVTLSIQPPPSFSLLGSHYSVARGKTQLTTRWPLLSF